MATVASQQGATSGAGAAATTQAITPTGITPGNSLILLVGNAGGLSTGALSGVADTGGNTWTLTTLNSGVSGVTNTRLGVAYAHNVVAPGTITATMGSIAARKLLLLQVSGLQNAAPDAVSSDFAAAANTVTTVPQVTLTAPGFVVSCISHGGTTEDTASAGWTRSTTAVPDSIAPITRAAWKEFLASGATGTMTFTRDSLQPGCGMVAFKTAAATLPTDPGVHSFHRMGTRFG